MIAYKAIIAFALFLPAAATAATWVQVGGNDAITVYVDKDTLRRNGAIVRSWLNWKLSKPIDVPNSYPSKQYRVERQLMVSNCQNNTYAIAQGILYADESAAEVVSSYTYQEKDWRFAEAAPDTIGESIIKWVCKATSPATRKDRQK